MKTIFIALIKIYQKTLSPFLGNSCRYHPSCSNYAIDAIKKYGAITGVIKSAWRILRCNPWGKGGYDPA